MKGGIKSLFKADNIDEKTIYVAEEIMEKGSVV
jgi:hypothetical protein